MKLKNNNTQPQIRLTHLILLLVLFSLCALSILQVAAAYKVQKDSLSATTLGLNYEAAQKTSRTLDSMFDSMKLSLKSMADYAVKRLLSPGEMQEELDLYTVGTRYFNSVFIIDEKAQLLLVSPPSKGTPSAISDVARKAVGRLEPTVSEPYISLKTGKWIVLMTYPIVDADGIYRGYVGGTIYLQEQNVLNDIFGTSTVGQSGSYIFVVDPKGNLLYHPDVTRIGENVVANTAVNELLSGKEGKREIKNTRGVYQLAGYARASGIGWGVVVQTPAEEIYAQSFSLIRTELFYSLPLLLLLLVVTTVLANFLFRPFARLAEAAKQLSEGKRQADLQTIGLLTYESYYLNETMMLAMEKLQYEADRASQEAQTDALTGLANRRTMDRRMAELVETGCSFAILALDIDHFKRVNDTYGHQRGDEVLRHVAEVMKEAIAETAVGAESCCCRFGGEEFVMLLPDSDREEAYRLAETVRRSLEEMSGPANIQVTVSIGIAHFPSDSGIVQETIRMADQALYEAKRQGRNRTMIYGAAPVR